MTSTEPSSSPAPLDEQAFPHHRKNFRTFVSFFIAQRVGWVFKTESVIIPIFLDHLGGNATVRGLLPVLSRWANSIPQYLLAHRMHTARRVKPVLVVVTLAQSVPWLLLGWFSLRGSLTPNIGWIIGFLGLYTCFWAANGMVLLTQGTLQGKLIPVRRRGRLMAVSTFTAAAAAIVAVLVWMLPVLQDDDAGKAFGKIFLASACFWLLTAWTASRFREQRSSDQPAAAPLRDFVAASRDLIVRNPQFRQLIIVVSLYYMILMLFPHFASLGAARATARASDPAVWIVVQNLAAGLGSVLFGTLADRHGNRMVLRLILAWLAFVPLAAIGLTHLGTEQGIDLYWITFVMLGFAPVCQRVVVNYALELGPSDQHARYLGTLSLWQSVPPLAAPLVGWMIDVSSYDAVFVFGSAVLFAAAWQAGRLAEPRTQLD